MRKFSSVFEKYTKHLYSSFEKKDIKSLIYSMFSIDKISNVFDNIV
jgi:hypothetical protein